jgi:hypothetical protein
MDNIAAPAIATSTKNSMEMASAPPRLELRSREYRQAMEAPLVE